MNKKKYTKNFGDSQSPVGGFTLIEIMIVIALIAIMGVFLAPDLQKFGPNIELNGAVRKLYGDMQNCKMEAVRRNINCVMTFNQTDGPDTFDYYMFVDADQDFTPDGTETVLEKRKIAEDFKEISFDTVTFTNNGSGNPAIGFKPNGLPVAPGVAIPTGTVSLKNDEKSKQVVLSKAGNVSIQET